MVAPSGIANTEVIQVHSGVHSSAREQEEGSSRPDLQDLTGPTSTESQSDTAFVLLHGFGQPGRIRRHGHQRAVGVFQVAGPGTILVVSSCFVG